MKLRDVSFILAIIGASFIFLKALPAAIQAETINPGDCYAIKPSGNPFEEDKEIYKCVIAVQDGWIKYYFVSRNREDWRCLITSDQVAWFVSDNQVKTEQRLQDFCP